VKSVTQNGAALAESLAKELTSAAGEGASAAPRAALALQPPAALLLLGASGQCGQQRSVLHY